jgi:hypothetical protein
LPVHGLGLPDISIESYRATAGKTEKCRQFLLRILSGLQVKPACL